MKKGITSALTYTAFLFGLIFLTAFGMSQINYSGSISIKIMEWLEIELLRN